MLCHYGNTARASRCHDPSVPRPTETRTRSITRGGSGGKTRRREEAPRKSFRRCTDVEEGNVSPRCAGKGSETVPRVKTGMTGRSCNEVPVSLDIFHRCYRIIGGDALARIMLVQVSREYGVLGDRKN